METLKQTIIILMASLLVVLAALPLAQTEWAEGLRNDVGHEGETAEQGAGVPANMPPVMRYTLPFVKELILMGIPGLLAYGILQLLKWISRLNKPRRVSA